MINSLALLVTTDIGKSLLILVQGMAGIFVFMSLFYLIIWGLEQLITKKVKK